MNKVSIGLITITLGVVPALAQEQSLEPQQVSSQQPFTKTLQGQVQTVTAPEDEAQEQVQTSLSLIPLAPQIPNITAPFKPIQAQAEGGQEEYNVNWTAWRHRITDAVWDYVYAHSLIFWGMTRVGYNVTRDGHVQITSIVTPDPTGKSAKKLVKAIKRLDGTSVLEFPVGSKQTIHHNYNMAIGLPLPILTANHRKLYFRGGTEHVTEQW